MIILELGEPDMPSSVTNNSSDCDRLRLWHEVLNAVGASSTLSRRLILRGAAPLRLVYGGLRPTGDLDFYILRTEERDVKVVEPWYTQRHLDQVLDVHFCSLPEYRERADWIRKELKIELSPCEERVECTVMTFGSNQSQGVLLCTLQDIIAGKLYAILKRATTERPREQDLFDVADMWSRQRSMMDLEKISVLFVSKSTHNKMRLEAKLFNDAVRERLMRKYGDLRFVTGPDFIEFNEAWQLLLDLVNSCSKG